MSSFKNSCITFLKSFDGFGETHSFHVNSEKTYNSPIGGCFCLMFLFYTLYYTLFSFCDYITGKNISKEYDLQVLPNPEIKISDHKYFSLAFCIRNDDYSINQHLTNNMKMEFYYANSDINNKRINSTSEELPLIDCRDFVDTGISNHRTKYLNTIKSFEFDECKCINFENLDKDFSLSSKFSGVIKNYFNFKLNFNGNIDIINYIKINNPRLVVYFPEYSADINNLEDPIPFNIHFESFLINPFVTQISDIYFGLLSFADYYSKTFESIFDYKAKIIFDKKDLYNLNSLKDNMLFSINFIMGGNLTSYKRNFQKIEGYLSEMLGYLGNIIIFVYMISWLYNKFGSKRFLSEKFFLRNRALKKLFKTSNKNIKSRRISKNRISKIKAKVNKNEISFGAVSKEIDDGKKNITIEMKSGLEGDIVDSNTEMLNNGNNNFKKNNYTIFYFEYLYNYYKELFCKKKTSKKYQLFQSTLSFYNYYMDISNYLKMMIEFEIIKSLLLNKNKRLLLSSFRPFLKRNYNLIYKKKLKEMYEENLSIEEVDKMITGISEFRSFNTKLNKFI